MSTLNYNGKLVLQQGAYDVYGTYLDYAPAPFTIEGLKAQFSFGFDRTGNQYYLHWSGGGDSVYISSGSITASQVGYSKSKWAHSFHAGEFPPQEEGRISGIATTAPNCSHELSFNVSVVLHEAQGPSDLLRLQLVQERENFARTVAAMSRNPSASDVRLVFPRTSQQLWANEALLIQSSPHYKTALSSAFAEGSASTETSLEAADVAPYTFEESDEETDKAEAMKATRKKEVQTSTPFKTITVTDSSYSTYLAVLVWLQSHHISFAPLRSSFRTSGKSRLEATQARTVAVAERGANYPLVPPPSSPKSIYRLAHLLGPRPRQPRLATYP
ncbi:hypothetical protein JCM11641_003448 [Rhodosporidiobolus odoratus]